MGGGCRLNLLMKNSADARCSAWHPRDATFLAHGPVSSKLSPLFTQPKAMEHVAWPPAHCPASLCLSPLCWWNPVPHGFLCPLPVTQWLHYYKIIHCPLLTLTCAILSLAGTIGASSRLLSAPVHVRQTAGVGVQKLCEYVL